MARKNEKKTDAVPDGEFEDIDLMTSLPETEDKDFDDIEEEFIAKGAEPDVKKLLAAKEILEARLILNVTEKAMAADSGTDLHGFENIAGVGISEKIINGRETGIPCVTVYVVSKVPKDEIEAEALVPKEIHGIPVDVIESGEFRAFPFVGRYRPAPGGVSVGHYKITAGTLGCLVTKQKKLYILSNNHVLANENDAKPGDPVLQPGPYDGGTVKKDVIAKLSEFVPIKFGGAVNTVDCAIAQTSPRLVSRSNKCFGTISNDPVACRLNRLVKKAGRTTQCTQGRITDCNATVNVGYDAGTAVFKDQIIVRSLTSAPFSKGGDSGSLIMTRTRNLPVGLLFAGSDSHTIANKIGNVLSVLHVKIVS